MPKLCLQLPHPAFNCSWVGLVEVTLPRRRLLGPISISDGMVDDPTTTHVHMPGNEEHLYALLGPS